ncbi:MAG TPA: hypothetical protein VGV64_04390, partial [Thermoplasmata archaeon]|nr:hypothetical protein [Thermoplasmata archaeon]
MLLNPGERILFQDQARSVEDGKPGLLILTNFRIVFETRVESKIFPGLMHSPVHDVDMEIYLPYLLNAQVEPLPLSSAVLVLTTQGSSRRFRCESAFGWSELISRARSTSPMFGGNLPVAPPLQRPTAPSHAGRNLGFAALIVILLFVIAVVVPVPHPFSGDIQSAGTPITGLSVNASTGSSV